MTTDAPPTLEARLAAELRDATAALTTATTPGPGAGAHARPMLRAAEVVPTLLDAARKTAADLEALAADPPPNLRTRARLTEQLHDRAGLYLGLLAGHTAACQTTAPPATLAAPARPAAAPCSA